MTGPIQCTDSRDSQPKSTRATGIMAAPTSATRSRDSGTIVPVFFHSGMTLYRLAEHITSASIRFALAGKDSLIREIHDQSREKSDDEADKWQALCSKTEAVDPAKDQWEAFEPEIEDRINETDIEIDRECNWLEKESEWREESCADDLRP